jgi:virginiamycin B lyase
VVVAALMTGLVMQPSPVAAASNPPTGTITEFTIPTPASSSPALTAGPDGNMWFTEGATNKVGRLDPSTGVVTEFPVPTPDSEPSDIVSGPDGALWFTEFRAGKIARITTAGVVTAEYPIPSTGPYFDVFTFSLTSSTGPRGITVGPDGNLWFAEFNANQIGRLDPDTGVISEFPIPTPDSRPVGITVGPDGNVWFTEPIGSNIGRITPTGVITEFPLPTGSPGVFTSNRPIGITLGPDGNLWFAENMANQIGRLDPDTGLITEFPLPTADSGPNFIDTGSDGALWFTQSNANQIGRITTNGSVREFAIPTPDSFPHGLAAGPDGDIWFTAAEANHIGRVAVRKTALSGVLSGAQEVGAGDPDGKGEVVLRAGPGGSLCYRVRARDIGAVTAVMIHEGPPGADGPMVVALDAPPAVEPNGTAVVRGCVNLTETTDIIANPAAYYVNVHSVELPGGAVRGQLRSVAGSI